MTMKVSLSLTQNHYEQLKSHLFPGDGLEAVAFAICGMRKDQASVGLLVQKILTIPYQICERAPDHITWATEHMPTILDCASNNSQSVVKFHSHPNGYPSFSHMDDRSDKVYFDYCTSWIDGDSVHASVIMLEDGSMLGRYQGDDRRFRPITTIKLIGADLQFWYHENRYQPTADYGIRVAQTFGQGTYQQLKQLKVGVVGCSGTGSIVIEQLARNCVGSLILVDPDHVEKKNLNRIPQATMDDALKGKLKVDVIANHVEKMGFGTELLTLSEDLYNHNVVKSLATCDVLFGCMDSVDGRHLLS